MFLGKQNCVARALYDNIAETPDELAFRKGDVLTVLEQNTSGLEGWWLCMLRGRQVIIHISLINNLLTVRQNGICRAIKYVGGWWRLNMVSHLFQFWVMFLVL